MSELFLISIIIIFGSMAIAGYSAAPWVPTKSKQRKSLIKNMKIKNNDIVYDLGSGDGCVLFDLAIKYPKAKFIGLEISILPYFISILRKKLGGTKYKNIEFKFKNLFSEDLSEADKIFAFLLDKAGNKLEKKFKMENLKNDCLIFLEAWELPNIEPYKIIKDKNLLSFFVYKGVQFKS